MKATKFSFLLFCAIIALSHAAPRGDISEEEDSSLEETSPYVKVDHFPSLEDLVDKVKDVVDHTKHALHKLKKPVKLFEDIKDKFRGKKDHKWTKVGVPPHSEDGPHHRPDPCRHYPPFNVHYAPPSPYYYYY